MKDERLKIKDETLKIIRIYPKIQNQSEYSESIRGIGKIKIENPKQTKYTTMAKTAIITFMADKMLPMLKKCLNTKDVLKPNYSRPAIDIETGLVLATNGNILAVHKLKEYKYEIINGDDMLYNPVSIPCEVMKMKGMVTVTVERMGDSTLNITAEDQNGMSGAVAQNGKFPNWRSVIPRGTGKAIHVDAKAWMKNVKGLFPKDSKGRSYMELSAQRGDTEIQLFGHDSFDNEYRGSMPVADGMPYGIYTAIYKERILAVLAFEPVDMHYTKPEQPILFTNDETIVLTCAVMSADYTKPADERVISKSDIEAFDLDAWIDNSQTEAVEIPISKPKPLTLAEQLRKVLMERMAG